MKRILVVLAGILALGCAAQASAPVPDKPTVMIGEDGVAAPPAPMRQALSKESSGAAQAGAPAAAPAAPSGEQTQANVDRMVVYNATVSLEVDSVGDAVSAIRSLVDGTGGMVAGAATKFQGEKEYATLTLRVPAREYNRVMSELRGMAVKVVSENGSAKDVTEEFTDLGSQLRNFEAAEVQYLELLRRANTIDEILKVQNQLNQVRGQIERTKGRMNLLQRTSDMATVVVSLAPVGAPSPKQVRPLWDPARSVQESWEQSLRLVGAIADVGLRVVVFSWWLTPVVVIAWLVWSSRRRPIVSV